MMRAFTRPLILLATVLVVSAAVVEAQQSESTYNYLVLARQAAAQGYPGRARELVDRGAALARTAQDWYDVADAYQALGYDGAAREASQKAQDALKSPPPPPRRYR